jgi:hypothetical protein
MIETTSTPLNSPLCEDYNPPADGSSNAWLLVSVPEDVFESTHSPWQHLKTLAGICAIGKRNQIWELAIDPRHRSELEADGCRVNFNYNPVRPNEGMKRVHGTIEATRRHRGPWLRLTAKIERSNLRKEVKDAYGCWIEREALQQQYERALLIYDIKVILC